jgi:broad specificity phosphatase PhoE
VRSAARGIILTLIRRGESVWEAAGRLHGRSDLPLSPGAVDALVREAARMGGDPPRLVIHAPDESALETAGAAADAFGARARPAEELAEIDLGLLEGMAVSEFADRHPTRHRLWLEDPVSLVPPEGEAAADARGRILAGCGRILRRARARDVALVLGPMGLGFLRCWLAERPTSDLWELLARRPRMERYIVAHEALARLEAEARPAFSPQL